MKKMYEKKQLKKKIEKSNLKKKLRTSIEVERLSGSKVFKSKGEDAFTVCSHTLKVLSLMLHFLISILLRLFSLIRKILDLNAIFFI